MDNKQPAEKNTALQSKQTFKAGAFHLVGIFWFFTLFLSCSKHHQQSKLSYTSIVLYKDTLKEKSDFASMKAQYDTLIPIMNGLFITYDSLDYIAYEKLMRDLYPNLYFTFDSIHNNNHESAHLDKYSRKTRKWGVIDSVNTIIIPFICDAVRELENGEGIFSVYKETRPLATGLPRYNYSGCCFFFDKVGKLTSKGKAFTVTTVLVGDFHKAEYVIQKGPSFYFPYEYSLQQQEGGFISNEYKTPR